jgi:hypothetical protein
VTTTLELGASLDAALSRHPTWLILLRQLDRAGSEIEQAMVLLAESGVPDVTTLPVGVIDRLLLHLHRRMLGADLECVVACPSCGALNALPLGPDDVPWYAPRSAWCARGSGVREPTGGDLLDLPGDPVLAGEVVLGRCAIGPADGPRDLAALDRVEQSLCGTVRASCTECAATIETPVDVQALVVAAVAAVAAEADVEVHLLASRYGWDLDTIEALPDSRRARLAGLVRGAGA